MLSVIMLSVMIYIYCYAKCHYSDCCYAECRYARCRYADCHGAKETNKTKLFWKLRVTLSSLKCHFQVGPKRPII